MNKYEGIGVSIFAVAVAFMLLGLPSGSGDVGTMINYHSNVCVEKISNGIITDLGCKHNVLTNGGKTYIQNALTGTATNISQLALGNGTAPAVGDTALNNVITTCGLAIANATYGSNGVGNWSQAYTWTSTCDSVPINSTGLYQQNGNMFAGTTFTATTLMTNDQIRVNYTVSVS